MKKSALWYLPVMLCMFVALANPQSDHPRMANMPTPPEPLDSSPPVQEPMHIPRRIDLVQLQRDADDLARTAQTIPSDMASVRKGMLPKDVIQKLKQIEKLSKHLRNELNP